jgi:hypothetical protein
MDAKDLLQQFVFSQRNTVEFQGLHGFPSTCQMTYRKVGDRTQFAIIHVPNCGTIPTAIFDGLATYFLRRFLPNEDAGAVDWFEVIPADVRLISDDDAVAGVSMDQANGVYTNPTWRKISPPDDPDLWAFLSDSTRLGLYGRKHMNLHSQMSFSRKQALERTI